MKELKQIFEEFQLNTKHSSLINLSRTIRKAVKMKIEISDFMISKMFNNFVDKDDYEIGMEDELINFLRTLNLKKSARKAL